MSEESSVFIDLRAPEVPPRISMKDPNFDKLTSAEKLNDSDYRSRIYQIFPNEPTCNCRRIDKEYVGGGSQMGPDAAGNFLNCRGGCLNECCINRIQRTVMRNKEIAECYQHGMKISNDNGCCKRRMRGGGCEGQVSCPRDRVVEHDVYQHTDNYRASNYHPLRPGEMNSGYQDNEKDWSTRKPCTGADCLIRAFERTKEFVDSLGKVPGLAGLGLADSMESPYFKMKKLSEESLETQRSAKTKHRHSHNFQEKALGKIIETRPFTLPSSGRRDTLRKMTLLSDYSILPEEKKSEISIAEGSGPCERSCCKSRRRKIEETPGISSSNDDAKSSREKRRSRRRSKHKRLTRGKISGIGNNDRPRRRIRWVYLPGDSQPGVSFGHKNCNDQWVRIPGNMGWWWKEAKAVGNLKPRIGWRPGKISRTLREIIKEIKAGALEDSRSRSAHSRGARSVKSRSQTQLKRNQLKQLEVEDEGEPPPTLHILRRDGVYYVTMYPIKQETMDVPKLVEPMKPLQFKILKDKDNCSVASSSSASDIEIEFSPPAAVNRYRKKPDVVHVDTQVKQQEILDAWKPAADKKDKKGKKGKK